MKLCVKVYTYIQTLIYVICMDGYICACIYTYTEIHTHTHAYSMGAVIVQWKVMIWKLKDLGSSHRSTNI